jgi:hypothetical protein
MESARVFYWRFRARSLAAVLTPVLSSADAFDIAHCLSLSIASTFFAGTGREQHHALLHAVFVAACSSSRAR